MIKETISVVTALQNNEHWFIYIYQHLGSHKQLLQLVNLLA
jgi:hypothetical protein